MDDLHASPEERTAAAVAIRESHIDPGRADELGQHDGPASLTSLEQDDLDLQNLGYKSVLARGWGGFDNFACSFSALYCIGVIRVLFYIALSAGGPVAMYVHSSPWWRCMLTTSEGGVPGSLEVSSRSSRQPHLPKLVQRTPQPAQYIIGLFVLGEVGS